MSNIAEVYSKRTIIDIDKLLAAGERGIVIPCKTEKFANKLMRYLQNNGIVWYGEREPLIYNNRWQRHKENTLYFIDSNRLLSTSYYDIFYDKYLKQENTYIDIVDEDKVIFKYGGRP